MVRRLASLLLGLAALFSARGQDLPARAPSGEAADSLLRGNLTSISFDKFLNTSQWNGILSYAASRGEYSAVLKESFSSTVLRTDLFHITDQQRLDLELMRRLADRLQAVARVGSFIVSDNQSIGISNVSSNALYGGIAYEPFSGVRISPLVGVRMENQVGQRDHGASYLVDLATEGLEINGYRTLLDGRFQYDALAPRTVESRNVDFAAEKYFFEQTRNKLQVSYYRNRRDFYSPADDVIRRQFGVANNIETRSEDAFGLVDSLDYDLGSGLLMTLQGNLLSRSIDRETRYRSYSEEPPAPNTTIGELRLGGGMQLRYRDGRSFDGSAQMTFEERDEEHKLQPDDSLLEASVNSLTRLEERKNNQAQRTSLASSLTYRLSRSHTISLSGSTSLLRYDTPSAENDDDRDELWYIVSLTTTHAISRFLTLRLSADANLTHVVYLRSTRSADNTWNRIFRLSPRLDFAPSPRLRTINTFEVLANYTAYDFEYPSSPIRSYAFRQFGVTDSSTVDITRRVGIEFFGQLRYYERGELQWDAFTERPVNYFEDRAYTASLRYRFSPRLLFSVGIRYFSQSRYGYSGSEKVLEEYLRSQGPITFIRWSVASRTDVSVRGWYERQSQTGNPDHGITNVTMLLTLHI
jgi:hypothetical protein